MGCLESKEIKNESRDPERSSSKSRSSYIDRKNLAGSAATKGNVEDFYIIGEEIGRGAFSVVREGVHKTSGIKFAVKSIEKKFVDEKHFEQLKREIQIMRQIENSYVLKLHQIFENDDVLTLVLEMVTGGELFYKIVNQGSYSERDASNIVRQIIKGVHYLHARGIAHRDLKPENLLCSEGDEENRGETPFRVVIADFGLSKVFGDGEKLETSCGTPDYVAPEVLTDNRYTNAVDMWSIGVITYIILCGFPPFYGKNQNELFNKILTAELQFPSPEWNRVSDNAKQFISGLIQKSPEKRLTAEQALEHSWLKNSGSTLVLDVRAPMKQYNKQRKGTSNDRDYDRTDSGELNPLKAAKKGSAIYK